MIGRSEIWLHVIHPISVLYQSDVPSSISTLPLTLAYPLRAPLWPLFLPSNYWSLPAFSHCSSAPLDRLATLPNLPIPRKPPTNATMPVHPFSSPEPIPPASIEKVEAWTISQAADVLNATSISNPSPTPSKPSTTPTRTVTLDIPLDAAEIADPPPYRPKPTEAVHTVYKRREPIRRDSLKRREALLKGKEGSRQRRRWENDRLLDNPYAQPPLPSDWAVGPTYPQHSVPYFLAPLWDAEFAARRQAKPAPGVTVRDKEEAEAARVTRELRAKLKRARGARGLLQDLETEVRGFVEQWEAKERQLEKEGLLEEADSEDEEIVFVGRNGQMSDEKRKQQDEALRKDKLVFESLLDDHGASFGCVLSFLCGYELTCLLTVSSRYLVHSIAAYYGLRTYSITLGDPARREAYVGLKDDPKTRRPSLTKNQLPRPLWTVV